MVIVKANYRKQHGHIGQYIKDYKPGQHPEHPSGSEGADVGVILPEAAEVGGKCLVNRERIDKQLNHYRADDDEVAPADEHAGVADVGHGQLLPAESIVGVPGSGQNDQED